ncbi:MAG: TonB-dependent receptor [Gammaproteobacteria bacterium]|nr:TonB-dependent receptor [Gammaproteobacteria bacterium]
MAGGLNLAARDVSRWALVGFTAVATPTVLFAQQSGSVMEEIVVTAQRRAEPLQEVPLAVSAYSGEQLETLQVTQALDMTRLVPNVVGHNNTGLGTANTYSIRGLNNTESIATFDPPVGSYVDDIYVARQNANNFTLYDVERIEVLRGPQGTLFGRNTTGGAVRVILKKPAEETGGYLEAGYGEYDRYTARGSIDVPVTDSFLTKFTAFWIDDDGYVENRTTGEDLNSEENLGLRAAALWRIGDGISWDLALDYQDTKDANIANFKDGSDRISRTGLSEQGAPLAALLTNDKRNFNLGNEVEAFNVTSNIEWDTGIGTLNFITGWRDLDQEFALDFLDGNAAGRGAFGQAPPPWGGFTISNDGEHEQFTQEVKLTGQTGARLTWVGGLFYLDENNKTDFGDIFDFDLNLVGIGPPGTFAPLVLADRIMENDTESWAAYAQADWAFMDQWTLTLGVRYTDEEKDISFTDNQPCAPGDPTCFIDGNGDNISDNDLANVNLDLFGVPREQSDDLWTPRVAVQYTVDDDLNYYASATRGFKSGGWNARGLRPELLQPFDSEIAWSYEAGMRSEWLDNTLRVNVTAFYLDVSDFQLPTAFNDNTGAVQFITRNFAGLENKGLELELVATPVENLTLLLSGGLQDAEYQDISEEIRTQQAACQGGDASQCNQGIVDPDGNIADPVRAPDYTVTLGATYVMNIGDGFELTPSAYLYAVGDHNVFTSGSPQFLVDGYTTYNASLELARPEQNWGLTLECKNCNDRTMLVSGLAGVPYLQEPRTWNLRWRLAFAGT